tara:strand:+ start:351 stop:635 length:285 start_codon:yes stop_codon:yes gene_type:complete
MAEGLVIYKVATGLIIPIILGLVKMYGDARVLKSKLESVQAELNEAKNEYKSDITHLRGKIDTKHEKLIVTLDKRFEKLENLVENYFCHKTNNK